MAMGQTSGSVASGTGMMGVTMALATVIQLFVYWKFDHATITDEQSNALALLIYPFIHIMYSWIGYNPSPPTPEALPPAEAPPSTSPVVKS